MANENFERAQLNNAVTEQKFFFRKNLFETNNDKNEDEVLELSLEEIFVGVKGFIGLNKVLEMFFEHSDEKIKDALMSSCCSYPVAQGFSTFKFLTDMSKGKIKTQAQEMREFVMKNKLYNGDSMVSDELSDELIEYCLKMQYSIDKQV